MIGGQKYFKKAYPLVRWKRRESPLAVNESQFPRRAARHSYIGASLRFKPIKVIDSQAPEIFRINSSLICTT